MPDVTPLLALPRTDPVKVCPACRHTIAPPAKVPMTGLEVAEALSRILDICLSRRLRLRLGPGITVDIMGVDHGGGGIDGWWCELEGGTMRFELEEKA